MRPWDYIDHECVPDDDGTIYLMNRGSEYAIHVNGYELMGSKEHGSEAALADLACDRLARLDDARILVGGLGVGFTLAAVLRRLGPAGRATVAELMPAVVRWNREIFGHIAKHPLRDPRVTVHVGDVGDLLETPSGPPWSAILLDVDNGPRALTRPTNGWLYTREGLAAARAALIPGGLLGIWSAAADGVLTRRLRVAGFETEALRYNEPNRPTPDDSGTQHLWMARRP
ncbi:MAG: hypothetical protein ABIO70_27085 [Pseudomonadota bacterium]